MACDLKAPPMAAHQRAPEKIDYVNSFTTVAGFPATIV